MRQLKFATGGGGFSLEILALQRSWAIAVGSAWPAVQVGESERAGGGAVFEVSFLI